MFQRFTLPAFAVGALVLTAMTPAIASAADHYRGGGDRNGGRYTQNYRSPSGGNRWGRGYVGVPPARYYSRPGYYRGGVRSSFYFGFGGPRYYGGGYAYDPGYVFADPGYSYDDEQPSSYYGPEQQQQAPPCREGSYDSYGRWIPGPNCYPQPQQQQRYYPQNYR